MSREKSLSYRHANGIACSAMINDSAAEPCARPTPVVSLGDLDEGHEYARSAINFLPQRVEIL